MADNGLLLYNHPVSSNALKARYLSNLERSGFADKATTIVGPSQRELRKLPLSFYGSGIAVNIVDGLVTGLETFEPQPGPAAANEVSIAPDRLVDLAFGDLGAAGVEERHPDVVLGEHRQLMTTLFPPITADFLLF